MSENRMNCQKSESEAVQRQKKKYLTYKVKSKDKVEEPSQAVKLTSVLDVLNPDRDCNCGVVARVLRSDVHKNIGMSERRDNIDGHVDKTCQHHQDPTTDT